MVKFLFLIIVLAIVIIAVKLLVGIINPGVAFEGKKGFPIIKFLCGNTVLTFLVDSGSSDSHITKSASKLINGNSVDINYSYIGSTGESNVSKIMEISLIYNGKEFKNNFIINGNLDEAFSSTNELLGVRVDGLLGSDFLNKYKARINFKSQTIIL